MKTVFTLIITILIFTNASQAQARFIVKFKNKGTNPFSIANPSQYLSQRAMQRRARYNIAIDSFDLPITPRYIDSVRLAGNVTVLNGSKWLNEIVIRTSDSLALAKIRKFSFVLNADTAANSFKNTDDVPVDKLGSIASPQPTTEISNSFTGGLDGTSANVYNYGKSNGQVTIHQGQFLHNHGFRGEGMQIGVLDEGFLRYKTLVTFDSVRNNNQILGTWDFVANEESVNEDGAHGMNCLSTIAANMPGIFVGTAPKSNFYLYRTEDAASETKVEEHNLSAGFERADSTGVDLCTVSLGYYVFPNNSNQNYTYSNMDGNTTLSAIAADIAASKGMLLVVAAGNEGNTAWKYVISPGDADSVMTVGAVDTLGNVATFSSFGPASDGRVKPNLSAVGRNAIVANPNTGQPAFSNGTSFATPNLAGLTTCLWQAFPEYNNMTILDVMQQSANKFTAPNDRTGYGIPDMKKAFAILLQKSFSSQSSIANCIATIQINTKLDNTMKIIVERKQASENNFSSFKTLNGVGIFDKKTMSFTDDLSLAANGATTYRLKIEIGTDTTFIVDSLTITPTQLCNTTGLVNSIKVTPNPVKDIANIVTKRTTTSAIKIIMTDARGQIMYNNNFTQQPGTQITTVKMQKMAAGLYYVIVMADGKKIKTEKIVKYN